MRSDIILLGMLGLKRLLWPGLSSASAREDLREECLFDLKKASQYEVDKIALPGVKEIHGASKKEDESLRALNDQGENVNGGEGVVEHIFKDEDSDKKRLLDLSDINATARSVADSIFSIASSFENRKVILAFDDGLGGADGSKALQIFDAIAELKGEPGYLGALKNFETVKSSPNKMQSKLQEDIDNGALIFTFVRKKERAHLEDIENKVRAAYIDEQGIF